MKILKRLVLAIVILVALVLGVGFLLPGAYKVERSTVIQAPAEVVFDQVNDLKKADVWSPWKTDPTIKITFGDVTAGKGASSSWTSEKMGNGTQTIEETLPNQSITIDLDFGDMGKAKSHWTFAPEGEGVKVTQDMTGEQGMNPVKRIFSFLMTEKYVGGAFEKGLASLKQVSETRAAEIKTEQAATQQAAAAPVEGAPATATATPAPTTAAAPAAPAPAAKAP